MKVRWTGDGTRHLALSGGTIECPSGEWVDIVEAAAAAGIGEQHALIAARGLAGQDDWETEGAEKRTTRKKETST